MLISISLAGIFPLEKSASELWGDVFLDIYIYIYTYISLSNFTRCCMLWANLSSQEVRVDLVIIFVVCKQATPRGKSQVKP